MNTASLLTRLRYVRYCCIFSDAQSLISGSTKLRAQCTACWNFLFTSNTAKFPTILGNEIDEWSNRKNRAWFGACFFLKWNLPIDCSTFLWYLCYFVFFRVQNTCFSLNALMQLSTVLMKIPRYLPINMICFCHFLLLW